MDGYDLAKRIMKECKMCMDDDDVCYKDWLHILNSTKQNQTVLSGYTASDTTTPGRVATRKRKVYSTMDTNSISSIEPIEDTDADATQPAKKRAKTASASSSRVRFNGVAIAKPTRKSTCTNKPISKKELFARLSQEYATISKMYEELSETWD